MDYYKILEIEKNASQDEIKKAYQKLTRKYYPSINPNSIASEFKFKEISKANEVLSNPEMRKQYDQYGENWQQVEELEKNTRNRYERDIASTFGGFTNSNFEGAEIFNDLFKNMFGESEIQPNSPKISKQRNYIKSQGKFRGKDIYEEIPLSLKEVAISQQKTFFINGKNIRISIPAGIPNGHKIRLKGYGDTGYNGGPNGDLYLIFNIQSDSTFERIGNDIKTKVPVDLYTLVLGGQVLIDTLSGKVKMTVPPESQSSTIIRLKGKGLPIYRKEGEFGDLIITYEVQLPKNLTEEQKRLFNELKNS